MQSRHMYLSILILSSLPVAAMDPNWHTKSDEWLACKRVEGSSLLEMKQVYECAPPFIKGTVEHLKDPGYYQPNGAPEYRFLMLHGSSGSGKSTLAKAMALYAGWDLEFTTPADYQSGHRGESANKLREKVTEIILRNAPTVLVIDEINQLLENTDSKHHDTDATSKELWTTMDKIHGNTKVFIIGTANRLDKIPQQIKTRIKGRYCTITMPKESDKRLQIMKTILNRDTFSLTSKGEKKMKEAIVGNPHWSGRDYSELCWKIKQQLTDEKKVKELRGYELSDVVVQEGVMAMKKAEEDLEYRSQPLTDDERQDLYQTQNMWLQLCMQRFQKHAMLGLRTPGLTSADGNYIIDNVLTPHQKALSKKHLNDEKLRHERY